MQAFHPTPENVFLECKRFTPPLRPMVVDSWGGRFTPPLRPMVVDSWGVRGGAEVNWAVEYEGRRHGRVA
eukprot:352926-Chlamydomonas_euryale.AAC.10